MSRYDDPFRVKGLAPDALEHYVVEWGVEDPARYARLSGRVDRSRGVVSSSGYPGGGRKDPRQRPSEPWESTTILTVVLEVPRERTEWMTSKLRSLVKRPSTGWLQKAAAHADDATEMADELVRKDLHINELMTLARQLSLSLNGPSPGIVQSIEKRLADLARKYYSIDRTDLITEMRAALRERKTEVAAKLLASMPDEDDEA